MSLAKVLFVDDEVPYVEALTKRLIKRDLEIIPAYRGDEALKMLAEQSAVEVVTAAQLVAHHPQTGREIAVENELELSLEKREHPSAEPAAPFAPSTSSAETLETGNASVAP